MVCFGSSAIISSPVPQLRDIFEELGFKVDTESFTCRGSMGPLHSGHPNAADLQALREFVSKY